MVTSDSIKQSIITGMACEFIDLRGDGHHFEAIIVSPAFEGKSRIQQHQLVYQTLGDRMREEIHALSMKTFTPAQWAEKQG